MLYPPPPLIIVWILSCYNFPSQYPLQAPQRRTIRHTFFPPAAGWHKAKTFLKQTRPPESLFLFQTIHSGCVCLLTSCFTEFFFLVQDEASPTLALNRREFRRTVPRLIPYSARISAKYFTNSPLPAMKGKAHRSALRDWVFDTSSSP